MAWGLVPLEKLQQQHLKMQGKYQLYWKFYVTYAIHNNIFPISFVLTQRWTLRSKSVTMSEVAVCKFTFVNAKQGQNTRRNMAQLNRVPNLGDHLIWTLLVQPQNTRSRINYHIHIRHISHFWHILFSVDLWKFYHCDKFRFLTIDMSNKNSVI